MGRLLLIAVCTFGLGAGCKDVTADIEALAERACKCTDAACADKVIDDLVSFAKNNKKAQGDQTKANAAAQKLGQCAVKAGVEPAKLMEKLKQLQ